MRIRTITAAATIAALSTVGFAGTALAADDYVNDYEVPGHAQQQRQGKVVTHGIQTDTLDGANCEVIVNTVGDFGGDSGMNDGQMMNRYMCDDGTVAIYIIRHNTREGNVPTTDTVWGSWDCMTAGNVKR